MTAQQAIELLKQGRRVRRESLDSPSFYFQMFHQDVIIHMEQVTSCAAREVDRLTEEQFLVRGELNKFEEYER